jgi:hypothetical protein
MLTLTALSDVSGGGGVDGGGGTGAVDDTDDRCCCDSLSLPVEVTKSVVVAFDKLSSFKGRLSSGSA